MVLFVNEGVLNSRGAEFLRNDELETIDIDASDHEDWTRSSAKDGLPMAQRLDELLQGNNSRSKHNNPKQRHKGKSMFYHDVVFCTLLKLILLLYWLKRILDI